jgi:hypothetical protein
MNDLVEFYRARLVEDAQIANAASERGGPNWPDSDGEMWTNQLVHVRRHDPARVLREVEEDRRLLCQYEAAVAYYQKHRDVPAGEVTGLSFAVKCRVAVHNDHPDYLQEWKP